MAMKQEDAGSSVPPATPQPQPFPATNTWGSQIPIDPALQQQSAQTPATGYYQQFQHYAPSAYGSAYQHYPVTATGAQTPVRQAAQPASLDTSDVATLNDALASGGVDLRAEEESLHRSYDQHQPYRSWEDRTRKQPATPNFNTHFLGTTMRTVGMQHKVTKIPDDSVNYAALALRARLQDLITAMIAASAHRTDTQFDRPASLYPDGSAMWSIVIRSDVAKQLAALEKVEREEELRVRRERKEREESAAAQAQALAAQAAGLADGTLDEDGQPKKKKKKEGPGVTARNMSEDVRKKMSNAVASQAAGLGTGKYAWMSATAGNAATPVKKAGTPAPAAAASSAAPSTPVSVAPAGGWARPYLATQKQAPMAAAPEDPRRPITLRDAMFVIEHERGHGGGRGAARGWS